MKSPISNTAEDTQRRYRRSRYSQSFVDWELRNHPVNDQFTLRAPPIRRYHELQFGQGGRCSQQSYWQGKARYWQRGWAWDRMKADGVMQELKVDAQKTTGDAKNATKESVDKTAAALKKPF